MVCIIIIPFEPGLVSAVVQQKISAAAAQGLPAVKQGSRAAWTVTVSSIFPEAVRVEPLRHHRRDVITTITLQVLLEKKGRLKQASGGVAMDQNPIKHCLA